MKKGILTVGMAVLFVLLFSSCEQVEGNVIPGEVTTIFNDSAGMPEVFLTNEDGGGLGAALVRIKTGIADPADTDFNDLTRYVIDLKDYADTEYVSPAEGNLVYEKLRRIYITIKNTGALPKTVTLKKTGDDGITYGSRYQIADRGSLFTIGYGVYVTFEGDITLDGLTDIYDDGISNNAPLFDVLANGRLEIKTGTVVTGNTNAMSAAPFGGGINIQANGFCILNGGEISNNCATTALITPVGGGGGVFVVGNGSFTMIDGLISGNQSGRFGGAITVLGGGDFDMQGGSIEHNSGVVGGGIYIVPTVNANPKTFSITGGTITDNTAANQGGGIYFTYTASAPSGTLKPPIFDMSDGVISGNHAAWDIGEDVLIAANGSSGSVVCKLRENARLGNICLQLATATMYATILISGDFGGADTVATIDLLGGNAAAVERWFTTAPLGVILQLSDDYSGTSYTANTLPTARFNLGRKITGTTNAGTITPITGYHIDSATGTLTP